ncbi:ribonuclease D [Oceanicella actignis]|uniref:Ribonuclease D n=1 Tax=Oceanicella actignis TaxID=1189325 RepID=A0A1M7RT94_9RHOB|nr:ribonuclease D [Oceanicella actignis]SET04636.1 ribonuclease D [Oceanicella actignis]SHN49515.1 ribonuclease D [Oceanicella actignis]
MNIITDTQALEAFCDACRAHPYVTVDTEFLRERTYWPQLCLVQMAHPGEGEDSAAIIDPLAEGISLEPLFALMRDERVVKVFHAARQDLEIFWNLGGLIPAPLFDTQVAAMVCGYGDQVGYETLVRKIVGAKLDKSSRFTDWAQRPLSDKQLAYALADVTHLRGIYEKLARELRESGRAEWVAEEMATLLSPDTYRNDPDEAWRRLKTRSSSDKFLAVAKALAAWRERRAQERNIPRNRLLKDDALLEIASNRPKTLEELGRSRLLLREARKGDVAQEILAAVAEGEATPPEKRPRPPEPAQNRPGTGALVDLLKVLLKARAEEMGVAPKLLASTEDLTRLANDDEPDVPALRGWRRKAFGELALQLRRGEIALSASRKGIEIVELDD